MGGVKKTRKQYSDLNAWQQDAEATRLKVRLIGKTKASHYYQALSPNGAIVGYFLDWQPDNKENKRPFGEI